MWYYVREGRLLIEVPVSELVADVWGKGIIAIGGGLNATPVYPRIQCVMYPTQGHQDWNTAQLLDRLSCL